jgi:hypothetical protein
MVRQFVGQELSDEIIQVCKHCVVEVNGFDSRVCRVIGQNFARTTCSSTEFHFRSRTLELRKR